VDVSAPLGSIEPEEYPAPVWLRVWRQPIENGHQPAASRRHSCSLRPQEFLDADAYPLRGCTEPSDEVAEPRDSPHAATHPLALPEVAVRNRGEILPARRHLLPVFGIRNHRSNVRA